MTNEQTVQKAKTLMEQVQNYAVKIVGGIVLTVTLFSSYGYNEGGLMDQMMDYSKEISPQYMPTPAEPTPVQPETTEAPAVIMSNDSNANAVGAPPSL